jgi:hypothetical protein
VAALTVSTKVADRFGVTPLVEPAAQRDQRHRKGVCRGSAKRRHGAQPNRPDGTRVVFGTATCLLLRNHELGEQRVERYRSERWVLETRAGSIDGVGAAGRDALGQQLDVGLKLRDAV